MKKFFKITLSVVILVISPMSCSSGDNNTVEGFIEYGAENYNTLNADEKKFLAIASSLNEDEKEIGDKMMYILKYKFNNSEASGVPNKVTKMQKEINMETLTDSNIRKNVMTDFIETYDEVCFTEAFGALKNAGK